ncbi:hypothetical protein LXL04_007021 [Taraxacum kok-saghyz]
MVFDRGDFELSVVCWVETKKTGGCDLLPSDASELRILGAQIPFVHLSYTCFSRRPNEGPQLVSNRNRNQALPVRWNSISGEESERKRKMQKEKKTRNEEEKEQIRTGKSCNLKPTF